MSGHGDSRLLYSVEGVHASYIRDGEEQRLTSTGAQVLSLLMVPTNSPFADLTSTGTQAEAPEDDYYLHLHLPPELDLPLPADTQIYHKPPRSYLIPHYEGGDHSNGVFIRLDFPEKARQDDIDTFETILAQCTAFMERAPPPTGGAGFKPYNPSDWAAGGKLGGGKTPAGQLVLVDEEDGSVVGELGEGADIVEDSKLSHGSKNPVEVTISQDGKRVTVAPVSEDYLRLSRHPAYASSSMVQNAASASRLIVTGSSYLGNLLASGADSFTQKTKPIDKPLTFKDATHDRVRKINKFTSSGAQFSAKTVGSVTKIAQNAGARLTHGSSKKDAKSADKGKDYKPGFLNKSMIAFSTVADGLAESGRSLLTQSGAAATTVVGHRYGPEAERIAASLAGGVKNVGLVYIDVTGVSRRAVIKSVAKGMVIGRTKRGEEVVVGAGDGGGIPEADLQRAAEQKEKEGGVKNSNLHAGEASEVGFGQSGAGGSTAPPPYSSELGEQLGSSSYPTSNEKGTYR